MDWTGAADHVYGTDAETDGPFSSGQGDSVDVQLANDYDGVHLLLEWTRNTLTTCGYLVTQ